MKILCDANISWRIAKKLNTGRNTFHHILDFFEHHASDQQIWEFSRENEYCILTNDNDFEQLIVLHSWPPKVIILKCGNQSNRFIEELIITNLELITNFYLEEKLGILHLF